jgi:serine/threonine-protein kinase
MAQDSPKEDLSFGQVAVDRGYVSGDQVREALEIQSKLRSMGVRPKRLGEILLERLHITKEQTEDVLAIQRERESKRKIPGYEILDELGRGGMGTVYRAIQKSMNREVALKVLSPRHARNPSFIDRFLREARAVAKLNHENIIAGIDVGEADGLYYFAMEYAEGETVIKMINRKDALSGKRALDIVLQIARALEHADQHGLVHRDIKPQNIIVTGKGVAKLCDLGLAKTQDPEPDITRTGVSMGTPHYISPEQAKGLTDVDVRSDIYSLGATLYHMVVGSVPFVGSSPLVVMTKHLTEQPPFPSEKNPEISVDLSRVILKMMEKRVEDRYQNPTELIVDIERVAEGLPPAIAGRRQAFGRPARERRRKSSSRRVPVSAPVPVRRSLRRGARRSRTRPSASGAAGQPARQVVGGRSIAFQEYNRQENKILGICLVAIVFMFALSLAVCYDSSVGGIRTTGGSDLREASAYWALEEARNFDRRNAGGMKDLVAQKYMHVARGYPGTRAGKEAALMYEKVMQRRK